MATPPQLTQFAFAGGLDESQQDEILDPLKSFLVLQNARQDRRGGVSKRLGYEALSATRLDASTRSVGGRLFSHGNMTCTIDGHHLDAYTEAGGFSVPCGRVPEPSCTTRAIWSPGNINYVTSDSVYCNGYVAVAYYSAEAIGLDAYIFVTILDEADGTFISTTLPFLGSASTTVGRPALAMAGTYVYAFVPDSTAEKIYGYRINTATRANIYTGWSTLGLIAENFYSDVATASLEDRVAVAYVNTDGGTNRVTVVSVGAAVLAVQNYNTNSVQPSTVDVSGSLDALWVAWNEARLCKVACVNGTTLATISGAGTIINTAASGITPDADVQNVYVCAAGDEADFNGALAVYATSAAGGYLYARGVQTSINVTYSTDVVITHNAQFRGRPFRMGGRYYAPASPAGEDNFVFVDWTPEIDPGTSGYLFTSLRPVAAPLDRGLFFGNGVERSSCSVVGSRVLYAYDQLANAITRSALLTTLDFGNHRRWLPVSHAGGSTGATYFPGGILSVFDGVSIFESAFFFAPAQPTTAQSGTGETTTLGGWRYVVVYEHVDAAGCWHVSGVSTPSDVTGNFTNKEITVTSSPLSITARATRTPTVSTPVRAALYRTTDGGSLYFRCQVIANYAGAPLIFDPDSTSDALLSTKHKLYGTGVLPGTYGGPQDHRHCPAPEHVTSANGVLVVATGNTLRVSSQLVSGEGLWFSPALQVDMLDDENITALTSLDGLVYAFKRTRIYSVPVEPPADNASVGGIGTPRRMASDIGCVEPCSVVVTSAGIFFQSQRGIELMSRGGAVTWVGEPIQRTLEDYPIVTGAVLDSGHGLVRFSLAAAVEDGIVEGEGRDIVFDLTLGVWQSVDDKTGSSSHEASQAAAMVEVDGTWRYGWIGADGVVYVERKPDDASAHLDGTTWVTMAAETSWVKTAGIQGRQQLNQVLALARKVTDVNLSVALAYNYETTFRTAREWTRSEVNALLTAGWPVTQLKHMPHDDAECQSVRLRLEDATPTGGTVGSGKGATWIALTLDITPKPGIFDVPEEAA